MFDKIFFVILLAIGIYYGQQLWQQKQLEKEVEQYKKDKDAALKLKEHTKEFSKPEIIEVTQGIHVAIGYALANSIMLDAPDGLIIIDTTESVESAQAILSDFRKISKKPIKAIIYTHNHADHVNGATAFLSDSDPKSVEIWAHHTLVDLVGFSMGTVGPATYIRAMRQFGALLPEDHENSGIGFKLHVGGLKTMGFVPPNHFLYKERMDVKIAGLNLELIHIPGETDDQIAVFWPRKNALFCADDFYKAFPNLYAIRGTPFRSLQKWKQSLDKMRVLKSEFLVPSHTRPVNGVEKIFSLLTDYRDAVQFVHDQTVRYMNKDMHPDEIANRIKLPKKLTNNPYLQEFYGTVHWSVKGLFSGYQGWFSGDVVELNPYTPKEKAKRLVKLGGGSDKVLKTAETSLNDDDPQWALQLASSVIHIDPSNKKAIEIRAKSLFDLGRREISANGRNYYLTTAYETLGKVENKLDENQKKATVMQAPMDQLFYFMTLRFKADQCIDLDKVVVFNFTDTNEKMQFHIRLGIVELIFNNKLALRNPDINVQVTAQTWRELAAGERSAIWTAATADISVKPSLLALKEVMDCFEK